MNIVRGLCAATIALLQAAPVSAEDLIIPGSGAPERVLGILAEAFNASHRNHRVSVPPSTGRAGARRAIEQNEAVLARTTARPLGDGQPESGIEFVPFALDAVVFAVGARVSVHGLTGAQLADIFSGRLTDWRELGGEPAPIRVVYGEPTEASLGAIRQHLESFRTLEFSAQGKRVYRDFEVLALLDRFGAGIGFAARSNLPMAKTPLRAIALDGFDPTPANVASGRYPMTLRFGLLYKPARLTPGARAFIAFVRSEAGRRTIEQGGVVPLAPPAQAAHAP
ncbi:MAG: substrate-binding domain-containing protein [Burkholderiales bacterium]